MVFLFCFLFIYLFILFILSVTCKYWIGKQKRDVKSNWLTSMTC